MSVRVILNFIHSIVNIGNEKNEGIGTNRNSTIDI